MKYLTIFAFLFLSIAAAAQLNIEEVSYVPSPSGYYTNLIIKGNANIKELETDPFNIQSYASFLDLNIPEPRILSISTVTISSTGTLAMFRTSTTNSPYLINIAMQGGNLSLSGSTQNNTGKIKVQQIVLQNYSTLTVRTENIDFPVENVNIRVEKLYIMGMQVPSCPNGYFWTPVYINNTLQSYQALACAEHDCKDVNGNPITTEEACVQSGKKLCTSDCSCQTQCPDQEQQGN